MSQPLDKRRSGVRSSGLAFLAAVACWRDSNARRCASTYLESAAHDQDLNGPLFLPVKNNLTTMLVLPSAIRRSCGQEGETSPLSACH